MMLVGFMVAGALALWVAAPLIWRPAEARVPVCPNCGPRPETDARFCSNCGAEIPR